MRKVCVVITARPSYSRIKTALKALQSHPDITLQIVLAGGMLSDRYGYGVKFVEEDGFKVDYQVNSLLEGGSLETAAKSTGLALMELATTFKNLCPDVVVVIADRYETIAVSIAAAYMNIPLAHIQGGEITGNIDEKVRHANSKLADLHFPSNQTAAERLIKMGEDPSKVFSVGCPSIDLAASIDYGSRLDFDPFERYGGVGVASFDPEEGYIVVMQHPVTTEYTAARQQITETLNAVLAANIPAFCFWPNVDAGTDGISEGIRAFREKHGANLENFHFFKSMSPEDFLKLIRHSRCLVGNSSVGIRESSYLGIPVVNIGSRQHGRDRGTNVLDVPPEMQAIKEGIHKQSTQRYEKSEIYGNGEAGIQIADYLAKLPLTIEKKLPY